MTRRDKLLALLRDVEAALKDLGACDDPKCSDPVCLKALPRVRAEIAKMEGKNDQT